MRLNHPVHFLLLHYLSLSEPWGLFLIFISMIVEGEVVLFAVAFLAHERVLGLTSALIAVLAGVLVGDVLWYYLGVWLTASQSRYARAVRAITHYADEHLARRTFRSIFIAKFIFGFNHMIIVRAGMIRISLKKFLMGNAVAAVLWIGIVGGAGYFSGASFALVQRYLRFGEIALLLSAALFLIVWKWLAVWLKKML